MDHSSAHLLRFQIGQPVRHHLHQEALVIPPLSNPKPPSPTALCGVSSPGAECPATNTLLPRLRAAQCGQGGPDSRGWGGHPFTPTPSTGRLSRGGIWEGCSQGHWQCQLSKTQKSHVCLWCVHRVRRRPPDPPTRAPQAAIDQNVPEDESCCRFHRKWAVCSFSPSFPVWGCNGAGSSISKDDEIHVLAEIPLD